VDVTLLGAWCELRSDFRHFRVERILASRILDDQFQKQGGQLMERWFALQELRET
jgi:predicted DNA-binding transcriptional regulator YafY